MFNGWRKIPMRAASITRRKSTALNTAMLGTRPSLVNRSSNRWLRRMLEATGVAGVGQRVDLAGRDGQGRAGDLVFGPGLPTS